MKNRLTMESLLTTENNNYEYKYIKNNKYIKIGDEKL